MKKAFFIMMREIQDFFRDKGDLSFSLLLPVLIFALMYGAFGNNLSFNGTAYIVNRDENGEYSRLLVDQLKQYNGLTVQLLTVADADAKLSRSAIQMAVYIPEDFSQNLVSGTPTQLIFKQRGNGGTEGQIVASFVRGAADHISQRIQLTNRVQSDLAGQGIAPQQISTVVEKYISQEASSPGVSIKETIIGSNPDPVNQFLPGIMTMFILFAVNLTAQSLVDERRKGTLERLITTRLKTSELFLGKFLAYLARGFLQTLILLLLAEVVFHLFTPLSFLQALLVAVVFAAVCSSIGIILGAISRTQGQATWISVFFTMLMVMLSGTFVAVTKGTTLYTLSKFSINTYANDAFKAIIARGGSLNSIGVDLMVMTGVAVVGLFISRLVFRVGSGGK
jgi:ABC-2 type transport system permease protein